jgi:hypothetical protein
MIDPSVQTYRRPVLVVWWCSGDSILAVFLLSLGRWLGAGGDHVGVSGSHLRAKKGGGDGGLGGKGIQLYRHVIVM